MDFKTVVTLKVIVEKPFEPVAGAHKGSRVYEFAKLLGASMGAGENCPIYIEKTFNSTEGTDLTPEKEKLSAKLKEIILMALNCEEVAKNL